jgi:hypothetical protein
LGIFGLGFYKEVTPLTLETSIEISAHTETFVGCQHHVIDRFRIWGVEFNA